MVDSIMFQFLTTINFIAIFALIGIGLAVTLGMMGVINLAHGEFMMLGAYATWLFLFVMPNFWICVALAAVAVALFSLIIERTLIRALYKRPMRTILATFGLGIILQELVQAIFGKKDKVIEAPFTGYVEVLGTIFSSYRLVIIGISIVVLAGVILFFMKTDYGLKARAIMANKEMASALGINTKRVNQLIFAIGAGLAALAGGLIAPIVATRPNLGADYIIDAFFVVVLGGVGSIWGPIGGAMSIGATKGVVEFFMNIVGARMMVLVMCIIIIRIKPKGLFAPR
jgi:branched-chain amino acid transport system permease protein/urea transport system permease protein